MNGIEGWMITIVIFIFANVAQFAVNKYQNAEFKKQIDSLFRKTDTFAADIVELQTQKSQYLTRDKADEVYLRIREFEKFEKHIDKRFDNIEGGVKEILIALEKRKSHE